MELTNESLVPKFRASGLTQKFFCERHGVSLVKLRYHLYRKGKNKTPRIRKETNKSSQQPGFITFNKSENGTSVNAKESTRKEVTIIHGRFSAKELASLLLEMEKAC